MKKHNREKFTLRDDNKHSTKNGNLKISVN
jgi:hypothetical protein